MRNSPLKSFANSQGLSPTALKDKRARDLAAANSPARKAKRAENQRLRRAAKKRGRNIKGLDYDHKTGRFTTVKKNRGNRGLGTKKE